MAAGRERQVALLNIVNPVPNREEQLVVLLHWEHAVEAADHRRRIAEIDVRQKSWRSTLTTETEYSADAVPCPATSSTNAAKFCRSSIW